MNMQYKVFYSTEMDRYLNQLYAKINAAQVIKNMGMLKKEQLEAA